MVIEGNSKYVLYVIDKFFIEVEWNIENDNIIGKGEFKCGDSLYRYSNVPKVIWLITQISKTDWGFIYEVEQGEYKHYEVFKKLLNHRFGTVSYPTDKAFGVWAWTCMTFENAKCKLIELGTKTIKC